MKTIVFLSVLLFSSLSPMLLNTPHLAIQGSSVESSFCGDLYAFDVQLYGVGKGFVPQSIDVYMHLVFPEGDTVLYQLDHLHHLNKQKIRNYISYSCELCLAGAGKYQCSYFVVDQEGNKLFDPQVYDFAVFTNYN